MSDDVSLLFFFSFLVATLWHLLLTRLPCLCPHQHPRHLLLGVPAPVRHIMFNLQKGVIRNATGKTVELAEDAVDKTKHAAGAAADKTKELAESAADGAKSIAGSIKKGVTNARDK